MSGSTTKSVTDAAARVWLLNDRIVSLRVWGSTYEGFLPEADDAVVTIGRDPPAPSTDVSGPVHASLVFDWPGVSRQHVVMSRADSCWMLADRDSHNGVYINGVPFTTTQVLPGDIISLGELHLMAISSRIRAMQRLWRRHLCMLDDRGSIARVDQAVRVSRQLAMPMGCLILLGRISVRLVRQLHDLARGPERPFVTIDAGDRPKTAEELHALIDRATHGTLFVRVQDLDADGQQAVLQAIAEKRRAVRVILAGDPGGDAGRALAYLGNAAIMEIPTLAQRPHEIGLLVGELVREWSVRMGAASDLRGEDWQQLQGWAFADVDDMEDVVRKFVALRVHRVPARAARVLGISQSALSQWMARYNVAK